MSATCEMTRSKNISVSAGSVEVHGDLQGGLRLMANRKYEEKLTVFKDMPGSCSSGREALLAPKKSWVEQRKWKIPVPFVIKVAPVGSFIMQENNPNQKYTTEEIRDEIIQCVEAGSCSFHTHARDSQGKHTLDVRLYREIINPVKERFGENVVVCGCPEGGITLADNLRPILEFQDIIETAPVTVTTVNLAGDYSVLATPERVHASVKLMQEVGCKPEIVLHQLGDISLVRRWLIDTKILEEPYYFRVALGNPGWGYVEDPHSLLESVSFMVRQLKEVAPCCAIMLDMAGRAGLFLVPIAIVLGLIGIRLGMEDSIYMYPHSDEMIKDNATLVSHAAAMVKALGRKVATADDYRRFMRDGVTPFAN